ncbi:MAG TPA: WD40 repeat domain-containing protein [Ktedonobacteraceae bacterium]
MDYSLKARLLAQLGDGAGEITNLAVSSHGRSIAIASAEIPLSFWHIPSYSLIKNIMLPQNVHSLTYSDDGQFLAAGLANGDVWIGTDEGEHLETIKQIGRATLAFVPHSDVLAVVTWKGALQLWQIQPPRPLFTHVFTTPKAEVHWQVSIASDGSQIASTKGKQEALYLCQLNLLARQEIVQDYKQFSDLDIAYNSELHYHPTEQQLFFLRDKLYPNEIVGLDTQTGSCISRIPLPRPGYYPGQFCFSPQKDYIAVTDGNGNIVICCLKEQKAPGSFPAHRVKGDWSSQYRLTHAIQWVSSPLGTILLTAGWGQRMAEGKWRLPSVVKLWHLDLR